MDRKEFLSRTLSGLDLIFVPSSAMRWARSENLYSENIIEDLDVYFLVGVVETMRLGLEVGTVAGLVYSLFN